MHGRGYTCRNRENAPSIVESTRGCQMGRVGTAAVLLVVLVVMSGCGPGSTSRSGSGVPDAVRSVPVTTSSVPETPSEMPDTAALPPHVVASDTDISLAGMSRRRIEIHVTDPNLSKEDAIALIRAYASRAGTNGQVSVRKPDPAGVLQPWAVDNMDGTGSRSMTSSSW